MVLSLESEKTGGGASNLQGRGGLKRESRAETVAGLFGVLVSCGRGAVYLRHIHMLT
jgi:hypothetical protein